MLSHLGPFLGGFVLPLVLFLVAKDKPFVRHHACEALNFAITYFLVAMLCVVLMFVGCWLRRLSAHAGAAGGVLSARLRDRRSASVDAPDPRGHRRRHRLRIIGAVKASQHGVVALPGQPPLREALTEVSAACTRGRGGARSKPRRAYILRAPVFDSST